MHLEVSVTLHSLFALLSECHKWSVAPTSTCLSRGSPGYLRSEHARNQGCNWAIVFPKFAKTCLFVRYNNSTPKKYHVIAALVVNAALMASQCHLLAPINAEHEAVQAASASL